jgi:hypothetical protein
MNGNFQKAVANQAFPSVRTLTDRLRRNAGPNDPKAVGLLLQSVNAPLSFYGGEGPRRDARVKPAEAALSGQASRPLGKTTASQSSVFKR